jgi:hypothetical protein
MTEEFLQAGQSLAIPTIQSKVTMQSLMELPNIEQTGLPGSLGLHEEYADQVAVITLPYLTAS